MCNCEPIIRSKNHYLHLLIFNMYKYEYFDFKTSVRLVVGFMIELLDL